MSDAVFLLWLVLDLAIGVAIALSAPAHLAYPQR